MHYPPQVLVHQDLFLKCLLQAGLESRVVRPILQQAWMCSLRRFLSSHRNLLPPIHRSNCFPGSCFHHRRCRYQLYASHTDYFNGTRRVITVGLGQSKLRKNILHCDDDIGCRYISGFITYTQDESLCAHIAPVKCCAVQGYGFNLAGVCTTGVNIVSAYGSITGFIQADGENFCWVIISGGIISSTVTTDSAVDTLPALSITVNVTVFGPTSEH